MESAMNVSLPPELEAFVETRVNSGFYTSASEVIREGLRLLAEQDTLKQKRMALLDAEIDKGLASLQAGKSHSGQSVYDELVARRKKYAG
jgi:antitoxin ParD1/3/4